MLARIVVMVVTCSWLVASAAAGQTSPPATVPVTRKVVGLSYVSLGDFEVRTRQVGTEVFTPDGQVSQWSTGGEVFVGRHVFTTSGIPVALELPVAYAPRIAQAPLDPFFTEVGLEQDAPYGALYVVPRLTGVYPADGRWQLVMSMGVGAAWFDASPDGRRGREVGYPVSAALAVGARFGRRWSARAGIGTYVHVRNQDRTITTYTAGIVRHF
jgi:hypothetical protein